MFDRRHALAGWLAAGCFSLASPADAQPSDTIWAQSLFDQARKLMEAGNYGDACPKLAESQRLDPGGGTLLNLAICYEKWGKSASAWVTYQDVIAYARKDGRKSREEYARKQRAELEPTLSHLTLVVSRAAHVPGLAVKLDGQPLPRAAWGSSMPIDPGPHQVEASAPGHRSWSRQVDVGARGDNKVVEVPAWGSEAAPGSSPTPSNTATQPSARTSPAPRTREVVESDGGNATLGYVVGGSGIALLGVGSYFGIKAFSTWNDRNDHCPNDRCDAQAVDLADDANRQGNLANVTAGLGLLGVGLGAYLVVSAPSSSDQKPASARVHVTPTLAAGTAGMSMGGAW
jgi:hypothetical protein